MAHCVIGASGILSYPNTAFDPLHLTRLGVEFSPHFYEIRTFDIEQEGHKLFEQVDSALERCDRVSVIGLSIGGNVVTLANAELINKYGAGLSDRSRYQVILIDPPYGRNTFKGLPGFISAEDIISGKRHNVLKFFGWMSPQVNKIGVGLPKKTETTMPTNRDIVTHIFPSNPPRTEQEWYKRVKSMARHAQAGHDPEQYARQLTGMVKIAQEGGPLDDAAPFLDRVTTTVISCVGDGNGTVDAKEVQRRLRKHVPDIDIREVDTPHAAILQDPQPFVDIIDEKLHR